MWSPIEVAIMDIKKCLILFAAATSGRKSGQPTALVPHDVGLLQLLFLDIVLLPSEPRSMLSSQC